MPDFRVHAVVPIYNNRTTLRAAVDSLLAEPLIARIHAIDDGSMDGCCEAIAALAPDRLVLLRQENAGPGAARNRGLDSALRDPALTHVLLLDADDELEASALRPALEKLRAHVEAIVALSGRYEAPRDAKGARIGEPILREPPPEWADRPLPQRGLVFAPSRFFGASGVIVCRRVLEADVRFDPRLSIGEDRDFLYRASALGAILVLRRPLLRVAIHSGGSNLTGPAHLERWLRDQQVLVERYADAADAEAPLREGSRWLLGHACRVLAKQGRSVPVDLWREYRRMFRKRGWRLPLNAWRWRYLRGPLHRLVHPGRRS